MNVLLITTDQQRADSIGAYGNPVCQTPNLDRLAAEGTRFSACRTQNPFCQPARATILTGTHALDPRRDLQRPRPARGRDRAVGGHHLRPPRSPHRLLRQGALRHDLPLPADSGQLESVEGSAAMGEDWAGPYFGFDARAAPAVRPQPAHRAAHGQRGTGASVRHRSVSTTGAGSTATVSPRATSASPRCSPRRPARPGTTRRPGAAPSPRRTTRRPGRPTAPSTG